MHCAKCPSICQLSLVENLTAAMHNVWALESGQKTWARRITTTTTTNTITTSSNNKQLERKWAKKMGMLSFWSWEWETKTRAGRTMGWHASIAFDPIVVSFFFFSYQIYIYIFFFGRFCCVAKATTTTTTTHAKNKLSCHWMMMHQPWVTFNFSCCFFVIYYYFFFFGLVSCHWQLRSLLVKNKASQLKEKVFEIFNLAKEKEF